MQNQTKVESVSALATASLFALACEQEYASARALEARSGRSVAGIALPVDVVVVA